MSRSRRHRWLILLLLFVAAVGIRILRATQETIANPDVMRYIDQAQGLAAAPIATLRAEVYHPLHAAAALLVHTLIHGLFASDRSAWLWSMRAVGILAGAIVTLEIVALARLLGAPFWAAIAASVAWLAGRRTCVYGSDGLSDMLALAFFGGAMLAGFHALRTIPAAGLMRHPHASLPLRRPDLRWLLAGLLAGLSYLTRPEGLVAVVILATSLVFLATARRFKTTTRHRWKIFPRHALAFKPAMAACLLLVVGAAIPALPYIAITHRLTGKVEVLPMPAQSEAAPLFVLPHIARELFETFFWPCALVFGLALLFKPHPWGRPRLRVPVILWAILWTWVMAAVLLWPGKHYLDGRHTLPLQLLLFALLAQALVAWQIPMRLWMDWWRLRPERWQRLPAWRRWHYWPRAFAGMVFVLMLIPGIIEIVTDPPRADRANLIAAARWINTHTRPEVIVADHEKLVGFYSRHPYGQWFGSAELPELHQLEAIRRNALPQKGAPLPPLIAGKNYEIGAGEVPALAIGPYRAIASFRSGPPNDPSHEHLYILYALPDAPILRNGQPAPPLLTLPSPTTAPTQGS